MKWYEDFAEVDFEGIDEEERALRLVLLNQIRNNQDSGFFYWLVREERYMRMSFANRLAFKKEWKQSFTPRDFSGYGPH